MTGWGDVVGKYPDGTRAVVEGESGNGWVILTGVHPEAPESWRRGMTFTTPARVSKAYAGTLVEAALDRTSLPHDSRLGQRRRALAEWYFATECVSLQLGRPNSSSSEFRRLVSKLS